MTKGNTPMTCKGSSIPIHVHPSRVDNMKRAGYEVVAEDSAPIPKIKSKSKSETK